MEFIKKIFIAVAIFAACALHTDSFARGPRVTKKAGLAKRATQTVAPVAEPVADVEIVVNTEREKIEQAVIDTEKIKTAATLAINDANEQLAQGKISHIKAAQIIGEQQYVIEQAKRQLAQLAGKSVEKVKDAENQESYLNQLFSGAQAAKAGLLEGIGYSSTAQQKAIAQAVIDELKKQLDMVRTDYAKKIEAAGNDEDKAKLLLELDAIKKDIEKEIYRQQTITEEVTSTNKKLFWSAVGLAGAAVGAALAYQYLGTETPELGATIKDLPVPPTSKESKVDFIESLRIVTDENGNRKLMKVVPKDTIPTETSIDQSEIPSAPAVISPAPSVSESEGQPEISQLPVDISGSEIEESGLEAGSTDVILTPEEKELMMRDVRPFTAAPELQLTGEEVGALLTTPEEKALELSAGESEAITAGRATIQAGVEKGIEGARALSEQYGELSTKALEKPEDFNQQQTVPQGLIKDIQEKLSQVLPDETEEAYLKRVGEAQQKREASAAAQSSKQPQVRRTAEEQKAFIKQDIAESGQAALEGAKNIGSAILEAQVTPNPTGEYLELSPGAEKRYKEDVIQPTVRAVGEGIVRAIEESPSLASQREQEERLLKLGTGGMEPSAYQERVQSAVRTAGETIATAIEESPSLVLQQEQEARLLPLELGTGRREIEADKMWQERTSYLQELAKAEEQYKQENNPELERLVKQKVQEWREIDNTEAFYNPEEKRARYEESREDFKNKMRVATQTPEKREQIRKTQEDKKAKIKEAQDRKRQTKDEGTQK